ncbi:RNA polymerase sporulation-specific sigma factor [Lachnospiraceae bacterium XBB1006]|nr:RNA polymerase sporulation-specific sigma factor [Lachnospiraceae bacterium XBB1006]
MSVYKVDLCGVNTATLPLLNDDEKKVLFDKIKDGDTEAKETYIRGNLRLVLSVIKRFSSSGENADDLFQIGCIGLLKSINNFDPTLGVKFSTYAVPMIIGEIRRYLRDNNTIRVSRSLKDRAYKIMVAKEAFRKEHQKEPTFAELSSLTGFTEDEILYCLDAMQNPLSLYDPVYNDGDDTLYVMDQVRDKKNTEDHWLLNLSLKEALEQLNDRQQDIITKRFLQGKTQMEVAEEIHISQAQVSRLEKSALKSMRAHL